MPDSPKSLSREEILKLLKEGHAIAELIPGGNTYVYQYMDPMLLMARVNGDRTFENFYQTSCTIEETNWNSPTHTYVLASDLGINPRTYPDIVKLDTKDS